MQYFDLKAMPRKPKQKLSGERLRELLEKKQVSKGQVAKALQVHPSQLTRWEQERTAPEGDEVRKIAEYFGTTVAFLYGLEDEDPRERLASDIAAELGPSEAKVLRAMGAVTPEARQALAERVIGWVEAEVQPWQGRTSRNSVVRRGAFVPGAPASDSTLKRDK
jgi:transcriptional regulator with XRE-family HTH domain